MVHTYRQLQGSSTALACYLQHLWTAVCCAYLPPPCTRHRNTQAAGQPAMAQNPSFCAVPAK